MVKRSIFIAAIIILLLEPESIIRASFQLSFISVITLITVHNYMKEKIR